MIPEVSLHSAWDGMVQRKGRVCLMVPIQIGECLLSPACVTSLFIPSTALNYWIVLPHSGLFFCPSIIISWKCLYMHI